MEIANVPVEGKVGDDTIKLLFRELTDEDTGISENAKFLSKKWGKNGENYVDGYVGIFGYNVGDDGNKVDQQLIA